jgi:DNA-binding IclR family transcriptional regulator
MTNESKAPAIARAAAILRLLGRSETPLGVNAIARELGLVPSTCLYVLRALAAEELVAFDDDTKRYTLEAGVLTLARGWLKRNRFADLVQPVIDRLAREQGVTMMGVQVVGLEHMIVVATAMGGANIQLSATTGSRFPALISATGRCIAAFGSHGEAAIERRFADLRWDEPPGYDRWLSEVAEARTRGYAVDDGNYIAGVTVIAAPVLRSDGTPSHALVALGISSAIHRAGVAPIGEALLAAARTVSAQLSGS